MTKAIRKAYWRMRFMFGRTNYVGAGHCLSHSRDGGTRSAVVLYMNGYHALLTPAGARYLAEQLEMWAGHAEAREPVMRFVWKASGLDASGRWKEVTEEEEITP